ncbi:hypothetical protein RvY_15315 [Ramazzottius varieornatus]|uniref:Uncharacterized protein n=1 Tax=Ramazzottius varieornatus TaxID=947166 RepID=A0A1D1W2J3_RAMVA|nr:hypothetical protein RvY_15315 [Ramazzottius varieornatus]
MPIEVVGPLPSVHNFTRIARRQRETHMPDPDNPADIDLDTYLEKSELGRSSVLYDSGPFDTNRLIVIKAEDFNLLRYSGTWIMDDDISKERKYIASRVESLRTGSKLLIMYETQAAKLTEICRLYPSAPRSTEDCRELVARQISIMVNRKKRQAETD